MAKDSATVVARVGLDDTGFQQGVTKIQRSLKVVKSEFAAASSKLGDFGKSTEGLKLKADSLSKQMELQKQKVADLTRSYEESVDKKGADAKVTENLRIRLNYATADMNRLEHQLNQTNETIRVQESRWTKLGDKLSNAGEKMQKVGGKMQTGLKTLVERMDQSAQGTGKGAEAFEQLGLSATDLNGKLKSQELMFEETVKKLQEIPEGAEKSKLAFDLFGKAGLELMPLLNSAGGSVDDLKNKAKELGIVISDEAIDAGVQFTDQMDQMKRSLGSMATQIGVAAMPMFMNLSQYIMDNMP